jgi:hypothetical protein
LFVGFVEGVVEFCACGYEGYFVVELFEDFGEGLVFEGVFEGCVVFHVYRLGNTFLIFGVTNY